MGDPTLACPFCHLQGERVRHDGALAVAIRDGYPVSPGHTLIIPRRHVASFFDTTPEERDEIVRVIDLAKRKLDEELGPSGYNIGINDGTAAGQTVMHVHVHLIPRFSGDCADPRGGIRWVLPAKAKYWTA